MERSTVILYLYLASFILAGNCFLVKTDDLEKQLGDEKGHKYNFKKIIRRDAKLVADPKANLIWENPWITLPQGPVWPTQPPQNVWPNLPQQKVWPTLPPENVWPQPKTPHAPSSAITLTDKPFKLAVKLLLLLGTTMAVLSFLH